MYAETIIEPIQIVVFKSYSNVLRAVVLMLEPIQIVVFKFLLPIFEPLLLTD